MACCIDLEATHPPPGNRKVHCTVKAWKERLKESLKSKRKDVKSRHVLVHSCCGEWLVVYK